METSNLKSVVKPLAIPNMRNGINISAIAVKTSRIATRSDRASEAKCSGSALADIFFERMGINAVLNAPSAKRRRNMLGSVNAIIKASAIGPEPRKIAIRISRIKPRTLLKRVHMPTIEKFRNMCLGKNASFFIIALLSQHLLQSSFGGLLKFYLV